LIVDCVALKVKMLLVVIVDFDFWSCCVVRMVKKFMCFDISIILMNNAPHNETSVI